MTNKSALRPVSSPGSRNWFRLTLAALPLAMVTCDAGQLEPDANAVAVNVLGLTADATKLMVTTTLDGKATTNQSPLEVTSKLTRFGMRLAKELTGTLSIAIESYDTEQCKVGTGTATTPLGSPYRFEVTASMKTVSPRVCPPPPPPKTCAPNLFCWSNPLPQGNTFQALWATSASDVWAVGDAGTIHHYDGAKWTAQASGTTESLFGVWAASANEAYAVGTAGKVLRYDGTKWSSEVSSTTRRLSGIWGSGSDAWAVGEGGTIIRRSGGTWSAQTSGVATNLNGVWGRSPTEIYTVGDAGVIRKFDGTSWTMMTSSTAMNLAGIWGDANTAIAVGQNGVVLGLAGTTWSAQSSGSTEQLSGVFSPSAGQYIAVGSNGTVLRGSGGTWSPQPPGTGLGLVAVRGASAADLWTAGFGGQLIRYDGTKWTATRQGFEGQIRSIAVLKPTDVWAVGDGGFIAHYDGTKWTTVTSGTTSNLTSIWAVSPTEIYAVGDNNTFLRFLGLTWSPGPYPVISQHARAVYATGSANIWSVATSPTPNQVYLFRYNGVSWSGFVLTDPSAPGMTRVQSVNAMWGITQGANELIYFVGKSFAAFSNVTGGTANTTYTFPASGAELRAVHGTASTDVWAVGDNGVVMQHTGAGAWQVVNTGLPAANLLGVWHGSTTSPLWVVGDQGTLWNFDGSSWAAKESNTRNRLNAVLGLSQTDFWVGGASGTMLHTQPQ
jgi:hypothetical protein